MKIIIDEREAFLYQICNQIITTSVPAPASIILEKRVLQLGDILYCSDDESITYIVIERKSFADLLASIKDGRYTEQSHRLTGFFPNTHNVIYLLEGMLSSVQHETDRRKIISCIASLNYFKGFSVLRTVSMQETGQHIVWMAAKIEKELKDGKTSPNQGQTLNAPPSETPYCSVIKASKKANITKENMGEIMLCQIPGISSTTAVELMRPFSNFVAFLDHVRANPSYLDGLSIETNGKKRKIGSNVIAGIREFLLGEI